MVGGVGPGIGGCNAVEGGLRLVGGRIGLAWVGAGPSFGSTTGIVGVVSSVFELKAVTAAGPELGRVGFVVLESPGPQEAASRQARPTIVVRSVTESLLVSAFGDGSEHVESI